MFYAFYLIFRSTLVVHFPFALSCRYFKDFGKFESQLCYRSTVGQGPAYATSFILSKMMRFLVRSKYFCQPVKHQMEGNSK